MQLEDVAVLRPDTSAVSITLEVPPSGGATPMTPAAPVAPVPADRPLPFTGIEVTFLIVLAVALILAGLLVLAITRLEPSHA